MVAALDALGQLDLLRGGEERHLADVLQEQLEGVGRDLGIGTELAFDFVRVDDLDLRVVESGVELVELSRLETELVERQRNLVRVETAGLEAALEQALRLVGREDIVDRCPTGRALCFASGQTAPLPLRRVTR